MRLVETVLWRRLDRPGLEHCRLWEDDESFRLEGTVLVGGEATPAEIRYDVACSGRWETQRARVVVVRGAETRTILLQREAGDAWIRNDEAQPALGGTIDIDLAFTPATNTLPIRRLSIAEGASADVRAAWLKFPELSMEVLSQRYTRLGADRYRYESASGFMAELVVDRHGLVVRYGELWERVE